MSDARRLNMISNHEAKCLKMAAETASARLGRLGVRLNEIINNKDFLWPDKQKQQMEVLKDDLEDVEYFLDTLK